MTLAKKLQYFAFALGIGLLGIHEYKTHKRISTLENNLKSQKETSAQEYISLSEKVDSFYQNQNRIKADLEDLSSALEEKNLSQDQKITLLNKYASAISVVLNKENERIKELTNKDENLANLVNDVSSKIEEYRTSVLEVSARLQNQGEFERERKIITPTIRMSCHLEVGSGTIIYSEQENGIFHTYVLTALHVVGGATEGRPIQISVFDNQNNTTTEFEGNLIDYSEKLDLAVVEIKSNLSFYSAKVANREEINNVQRFDDVYAVGCPLGYFPIQTEGEITSQNKVLNSENYWMVNAETIFGNSGGGIFLKENNKMIGVLTRVSAYNNFINIAVPHMGIVVSGNKIYDWLDQSNLQFLYNSNNNRQECLRRRAVQNRRSQEQPQQINDPSSIRNVLR